jgi:hypothetical protein
MDSVFPTPDDCDRRARAADGEKPKRCIDSETDEKESPQPVASIRWISGDHLTGNKETWSIKPPVQTCPCDLMANGIETKAAITASETAETPFLASTPIENSLPSQLA